MKINLTVDLLFAIDILVSFISAYEDLFTGTVVTSFCQIAKHYI